MLDEKWIWRKWTGPKQLTDKTTGTLMMLPFVFHLSLVICRLPGVFISTDYALVQDKTFKKYVKAYAADQDLFFKEYEFLNCFIVSIVNGYVPQLLRRRLAALRARYSRFAVHFHREVDAEVA